MPSRAEHAPRRLLAQGLLAVLLVLAAIVAYLTVAPAWRPMAIRLACTLIVIAGCIRARRGVQRALEGDAPSMLDASPAAPPAPELDARFLRLRDDLVFSTRNRRYFDAVLWPRLLDLAGGNLLRPPDRRGPGRRGPSLGALARVVGEIEERA